jgi:ribosomal protein L25 (general stress protein Ctc)
LSQLFGDGPPNSETRKTRQVGASDDLRRYNEHPGMIYTANDEKYILSKI